MPRRLQDQFSALVGTVSRQRIWQLRKRAAGLCVRCGGKIPPKLKVFLSGYCVGCAGKVRDKVRAKNGTTRTYNSLSRRIEAMMKEKP